MLATMLKTADSGASNFDPAIRAFLVLLERDIAGFQQIARPHEDLADAMQRAAALAPVTDADEIDGDVSI